MGVNSVISDHPANRSGVQHERWPIEATVSSWPTHKRAPEESETQKDYWRIGDEFHEWMDDKHQQRREARYHGKTVEVDEDQQTGQPLRQHESCCLCDRDLFRRDAPRACAFAQTIEITVHQI